MAWYDQLQPASFRGVPFQVDSIDHQAGDNVVLREYPFADLPTVFRMGEAAEEIKLSAYVVGPDYMAQRDLLRSVLSGEGELVHPTAGRLKVWVAGKYTLREAPTAEGGVARFDLTFVRAEPRRYPRPETDTPTAARTAASDAQAVALDQFAAEWSIAGLPDWVGSDALARVADQVGVVWQQMNTATAALAETNATLLRTYQQTSRTLASLAATPRRLGEQLALMLQLPGEVSQATLRDVRLAAASCATLGLRTPVKPFEVRVVPPVDGGLVMYGTGLPDALPRASAARESLTRLQAASDRLVETLATAAWVDATARLELANYDEALALRSWVHQQVMRLLQGASEGPAPAQAQGSNWYDAVLTMLTVALADLQARSRGLVRLMTYVPQGVEPVWLVSYRLFGTGAWADEILAMNPHVRNPLLVPAGVPLRLVDRR